MLASVSSVRAARYTNTQLRSAQQVRKTATSSWYCGMREKCVFYFYKQIFSHDYPALCIETYERVRVAGPIARQAHAVLPFAMTCSNSCPCLTEAGKHEDDEDDCRRRASWVQS